MTDLLNDTERLTIAVIGLGHIGLPLAAQYAGKGHRVLGCDIDPAVVDMVNAGRGYMDEPGLTRRVAAAVDAGLLSAQTCTSLAVAEADVVVVIVPLVVEEPGEIAYGAIDAATCDVAAGLRPGTLMIYETTVPVGDTRRRFGPLLEVGSGLRAGEGFHLAFSPERVYVGRVFEDLRRYPKVVGGIDAASTDRAVAFYRAVLDAEVMPVANAETAEFSKIAETTYRDVNIALANEFARYAEDEGIDVVESIAAANSQPYSHIHQPGPGVGGHCIPVYPQFFANRTESAQLTRLAREINDGMAEHVANRLAEAMDGLRGRTVAVFGWAYRENVKEDAFSVARRLVTELEAVGANVVVDDPMYEPEELRQRGVTPREPGIPVDAVVIQAAHDAYRRFDWASLSGLRVILDARNALAQKSVPEDVRYIGVGRGTAAELVAIAAMEAR